MNKKVLIAIALCLASTVMAEMNAFENIPTGEVRFGPGTNATPVVAGTPMRGAQTAEIKVDAGKVVGKVSPLIYGMNMEDLNHEIYGGLYAQMIFGESFEEWPDLALPEGWMAMGYYKPCWAGMVGFNHGVIDVQAIRDVKLVWRHQAFSEGEVSFEVLQPSRDFEGVIDVIFGMQLTDKERGMGRRYNLRLGLINNALGLYAGDGYVVNQHLASTARIEPRLKLDQWNRVRLVISDKRIEVYVNEAGTPQLVHELKSAIPAGYFGFELHDAHCRFRNLEIKTGGKIYDLKNVDTSSPLGKISQWWEPVVDEGVAAAFSLDEENPFNTDRAQKIEFRSGKGRVGLINRGLCKWGLNLVKGMTYQGRIYLRGDYRGAITVALQSADGSRTYASRRFTLKDKQWAKYPFELKSNQDDTNARFAFWLDRPGTVWVDQAVLLPTGDGLYKGLPARRDYVQTTLDMGTRLMRWGGDATNPAGWRWKNLVGDPDKRRQFRHPWYPFESSGFGLDEFIRVCRAAGIEPIVELNGAESPASCAEFIAYCNSPATSKAGKERAANGSREPYRLKYLKISNGFCGTPHMVAVADAVHAVDPGVIMVGGALTHHYLYVPPEERMAEMARALAGKVEYVSVLPYADQLGDAHGLELLLEKLRHRLQPASELGHPIRLYSQEVNGGRLDMQRALSDMQYLNVCERNSDFVDMVTYCNLSASVGHLENGWNQARFYFDNRRCWLQPTGLAFQMASRAFQPVCVWNEVTAPLVTVPEYFAERPPQKATFDLPSLNVSATRSEAGDTLVLKVVNINSTPVTTQVHVEGMRSIQPRAQVVSLTGANLNASNPPSNSEAVKPVTTDFEQAGQSFAYTFPGHSFTVITLHSGL